MARVKRTKKSRIKRCVKRALKAMTVLTVFLCVSMTAYMFLLEYGIVKLDSKNQVKAAEIVKSNEVDTGSLYKEKESSVKTKLEEQDAERYAQNQRTAEKSNEDTAKESDEVRYGDV